MATKKKREPTHWRRSVEWTRLGPDGAPAEDGLTKLGTGRWEPADPSEEGAVATAGRVRIEREERERHPIDLLLADSKDVLRAVDALAEADLEGPGTPALWGFAFNSSTPHTTAVLAARALCAAIRAREAIARGDAADAARYAYFAAHHWQMRNQKRQEPERISGRRRRGDGAAGGVERGRKLRQRRAEMAARWDSLAGNRRHRVTLIAREFGVSAKTVENAISEHLKKISPA